MHRLTSLLFLLLLQVTAWSEEFAIHSFQRVALATEYFSEGISSGDLNGDGIADVVYGPLWFAGPDYKTSYEIYQPVPQNREGYANHFFSWVYDFNGDGWGDVLTVGFPGTPAYVYENPGKEKHTQHWMKHEVFDWVSNESPQFTTIVGDDRPELVCTRDGFFGYASINWDQPLKKWTFHPISEQVTAKKFGHGLGIGDLNGDGLLDIIHSQGWYEQPAENADSSRWQEHRESFSTSYGGAEMYAYDVDGDGDNDVITSVAAHDFGLAWYEQIQVDGEIAFKQHLIMGEHPSQNEYGVLFSELHSVNLVDIDGDGLKDIVTGKTYYSHHKQSPLWDAGAVVYWFRLTRHEQGVQWVPYQADGNAGVGRQVVVSDLNKDGLPDILAGGMVGAHVLLQDKKIVSREIWEKGQPQKYVGKPLPTIDNAVSLRGAKAPLNAETGRVPQGIEGESLKVKPSSGAVRTQGMEGFTADRWSGNSHLFWTGGRPGDELIIPFSAKPGTVDLEFVLTCARDYGIVQLSVDETPLGPPIDLFDPQVITSGVLKFADVPVTSTSPQLKVLIVGANTRAQKGYLFGLDYLRILQESSSIGQ